MSTSQQKSESRGTKQEHQRPDSGAPALKSKICCQTRPERLIGFHRRVAYLSRTGSKKSRCFAGFKIDIRANGS
jgi:hypothetical protein